VRRKFQNLGETVGGKVLPLSSWGTHLRTFGSAGCFSNSATCPKQEPKVEQLKCCLAAEIDCGFLGLNYLIWLGQDGASSPRSWGEMNYVPRSQLLFVRMYVSYVTEFQWVEMGRDIELIK